MIKPGRRPGFIIYEQMPFWFLRFVGGYLVKMEDGLLTSVDNKRLVAAQATETKVNAIVHMYDDAIPYSQAKRFPNSKGGLPTTWGEAVQNRVKKQSFRKTHPYGTFETPKWKKK